MAVTLELGDITRTAVDVIVNAANSSLLGGGGVDGAIHRAGGPEILQACRALRVGALHRGLAVGDAVATTAGRLPARWVVHTVGPRYSGDAQDAGLLARAHRSCLAVASELGARSVAFPAISTGVYGYPVALAAPIALAAAREAADLDVRFVLFSPGHLEAFRAAARELGVDSV